jgi:hypothetical protein
MLATMDFTSLVTSLQTACTTNEILSLVGTVVGASAGLMLAWFGARKISKSVINAFKGGRIKF